MSYQVNEVGEQIWKNMQPDSYLKGSGPLDPELTEFTPISGMFLHGFTDSNDINELFCTFEIPHDYKAGTNMYPHIHWTPHTSGTGNVFWQFSYSIGDDNRAFTHETTISATSPVTTVNAYHSTEFSPAVSGHVNGDTIYPGAIILGRLFRDSGASGDTYNGIAKLFTFGIHYQVDKHGSTTIFAHQGT